MAKLRGHFIILRKSSNQNQTGVYELIEKWDNIPNMSNGYHPACPRCRRPMVPVIDIQQFGFWDDQFHTFLVCNSCTIATLYVYQLSHIETGVTRREGQETQ